MSSRRNYIKSNKILTINFQPTDRAQRLVRKLLEYKKSDNRQKISSLLIPELCTAAKVPLAKVKISDTRQYHKRRGGSIVFKQYGYYKPDTNYIYMQNRTPARGQLLAGKTFIDSLLHEWLHHYDTHKLKLDSIHTAGFYTRLRDLKTKLNIA
jgi:hypothetical protein